MKAIGMLALGTFMGWIIAYGMRNPFRFTFDPNGRVYIGDVGSTEWEEIDVARAQQALERARSAGEDDDEAAAAAGRAMSRLRAAGQTV